MKAFPRSVRSRVLGCAIAGVVFCVPGLIPPAAADKTYSIAAVSIQAELAADGSMRVVEARTYDFNGRFRSAYRKIPSAPGERYVDIQVSEGGHVYTPAESEEPSTFRVTREGDEIEVRWFFQARNESRTFVVSFRVENLVRRHDDAALLYYQFIGADWSRPQRRIDLSVRPPESLNRDDVRAWLHGPLWGEIRIRDDGSLHATCERLPARRYFEIRALYPPEAFASAAREAGAVRPQVMEEEARWAEAANRERAEARERYARTQARHVTGKRFAPVLAVLALFAGVLVYRRYGRRPDLPPPVAMTAAPPSETPPALVGYLLNSRAVGPRDLVATILDLARRGFLSLHERAVEKRKLFGGTRTATHYIWTLDREAYERRSDELLRFERSLIQFLFDKLAGGADEVDIASLNDEKREVRRFYAGWSKAVKQEAAGQNFYNAESLRGMGFGCLLGAAVVVAGIPLTIFFGPWCALVLFAGIVDLIIALFIPHRTVQGESEARGWRALKRYIKQMRFRETMGANLLGHMSAYLVYATAFGVSERVYKQLIGSIPEGDAATYVPWYVWSSGGGHFSPASFSSAFSSMVASATSTVSSAAGAGGGASGGGGGGSGGGGGGAG